MFRFVKPSRPVRKVFFHCSASDNPDHDNVATMDAWHKARKWSGVGYHLFCRKSGHGEAGRSLEKTPAAQKGHNSGSIAICLHGLAESKFTKAQKNWLIDICCQINDAYDGNVTFHGHNEVAAKACPVIDYKSILKLDANGRLGVTPSKAKAKWVSLPEGVDQLEEAEAADTFNPTLRIGAEGEPVRYLQRELKRLNYHSGLIDGKFGKMTRGAVLAFQADNYLIEDGIVGGATYEALEEAEPREISRERSKKSVAGLAHDGSRIAQASLAQGLMGTTFTAGGVVALVEENSGFVSRMADGVGTYSGVIKSLGPWLGAIVVVGGLIVLFQAIKAGKARREDHRTGRTA